MRSREIQQFLASITGRPISEIDQRCRPLRKSFEITTGPRGSAAPHMDVGEAVYHVLALASRRPGDALEVASRLLSDCHVVAHPVFPDLTAFFKQGKISAGAMVASVMMGSGFSSAGFDFISFEFAEDGHLAWLNLNRRSLKNLRFLFSTAPEQLDDDIRGDFERYQELDKRSASSRFVIGAAHLRDLGAKVRLDQPRVGGDVE